MKIIKGVLLVVLLSVFAFADDDKENQKVLKNLYDKVILKDVNNVITSLNTIDSAVKAKDVKKSKVGFEELVKSWKAVESFYILGDINDEYIDIPRYFDIFHNANEDITEQLDRAIKSKDEIRVVLFKNSLKSINALEYILYAKDITNDRVNGIASTIVSKLKILADEIKEGYVDEEENFLSDLQKANSFTINAIISSTYKLKEWRIGEVMGITKKYEGKPDNKRAEYYLSKNSALAIEAVLNNYKEIFDSSDYEDYGDYVKKITNGEQIDNLREALKKALKYVKEIKNDDFANAQNLYDEVSEIHVILFLEVIEELSINAKIIEADGD